MPRLGIKQLRKYLSRTVDRKISQDDALFAEVEKELVDNLSRTHSSQFPLFDEDFYLAQRGSRLAPDMTPLKDYFYFGSELRLSPHPLIDMSFLYRAGGGDITGVTASELEDDDKLNPILRILYAKGSDCAPNALFDVNQYMDSVKTLGHDLSASGEHPVLHYLTHWRELADQSLLKISNYFDPIFFDMSASRTRSTLIDPMSHYFRHGSGERPDCNPRFHGRYYHVTYKLGDIDGLSHFVQIGSARGLSPNPFVWDELGMSQTALPPTLMQDILLQYVKLRRV